MNWLAVAAALITVGVNNQAAYAPDGYPQVIPPPGSPPPTVVEWNAVTREVNVKNASAYHCETKMLREWFRASCGPYDSYTLKDVNTLSQSGQQAFVGVFGSKASVVVQVVEGKTCIFRFTWAPNNSMRDLTVSFPKGGRPSIFFN